MDKLYILSILRPAPKFNGTVDEPNFEWIDDRPYPSDIEFALEHNKVKTSDGKKNNNKSVKSDFEKDTKKPFKWKGHTYISNRQAWLDITGLLALHAISPFKEVKILDTDYKSHTLTIGEFLEYASAFGRHHYDLRMELWGKLK